MLSIIYIDTVFENPVQLLPFASPVYTTDSRYCVLFRNRTTGTGKPAVGRGTENT
jgi:hypothetical protein